MTFRPFGGDASLSPTLTGGPDASFPIDAHRCGDLGGGTEIGGKIYTLITKPRTIGVRLGYEF